MKKKIRVLIVIGAILAVAGYFLAPMVNQKVYEGDVAKGQVILKDFFQKQQSYFEQNKVYITDGALLSRDTSPFSLHLDPKDFPSRTFKSAPFLRADAYRIVISRELSRGILYMWIDQTGSIQHTMAPFTP